MVQISEKQGKKTLELTTAKLVLVGEAQTGTSQRTGNKWKVRTVNIKFSLSTNMEGNEETNTEGNEETMIVAAKCFGDVCDRVSMVPVGSRIHAFIRLDVNTRFKTPQTECTLVDFTF